MFWLTFDFLLQADGQSDSAQKLFGPKKCLNNLEANEF